MTGAATTDPRPPTGGSAAVPPRERFLGVDVTRGIALLTMLAANVFQPFDENGKPSLAVMTVLGRSATLFALVAGISLAFMTGGRRPVQGTDRRAAAVGIAVRAVIIGAIGLTLGPLSQGELEVILPFYATCFLLAVPLIGLGPRALAGIAAALVVISPLILLGAASLDLSEPAFASEELTFTAPLVDPTGFVLQLLVTGYFPAVIYLIYICAGMAIGRLDLSSARVAVGLLAGGLGMAALAWVTSTVLLFRLGGLTHLAGVVEPGGEYPPTATVTDIILWNPEHRVGSWWWLALRAHHTGTPVDVLQTMGSAMAVLGAVLLVVRLPVAQRLLRPVAVAGAMTLTIYSAHIPVVGTGLLLDEPYALYTLLVAGALAFAMIWRYRWGQGPLERMVAIASGYAKNARARQLQQRADLQQA